MGKKPAKIIGAGGKREKKAKPEAPKTAAQLFELGQRHQNGTGVKKDVAAAAKYYQEDKGHTKAVQYLGALKLNNQLK